MEHPKGFTSDRAPIQDHGVILQSNKPPRLSPEASGLSHPSLERRGALFRLVNVLSSPDGSELPCSADSGRLFPKYDKRCAPDYKQKSQTNVRLFCF